MINIPGVHGYLPAAKHVNNYIKQLMLELLIKSFEDTKGVLNYNTIDPHNIAFINDIQIYFPLEFKKSTMGTIFLDLFALISDSQYHSLNLIEEYIVYYLIRYSNEKNPMYIMSNKLKEEIENDLFALEVKSDEAHHFLYSVQNTESYLELCFDDWDMLMLDEYSFEELKELSGNSHLGMVLSLEHQGPTWEEYIQNWQEGSII